MIWSPWNEGRERERDVTPRDIDDDNDESGISKTRVLLLSGIFKEVNTLWKCELGDGHKGCFKVWIL